MQRSMVFQAFFFIMFLTNGSNAMQPERTNLCTRITRTFLLLTYGLHITKNFLNHTCMTPTQWEQKICNNKLPTPVLCPTQNAPTPTLLCDTRGKCFKSDDE